MIDTIKGYMDITNKKYSDIEHLLTNKTITEKEGGYKTTFNLSNFKITITFDERYNPVKLFFNGSLTKIYYGNNLAQLDWDSTKKAIQMLFDNLSIDVKNATLTRIDFGVNIVLKKPIFHYTSCLIGTPRLKWQRHKESITFFTKSGSKSLTFYDKLVEMKNRSKTDFISIPIVYRSLNVLRYELRLNSRLKDRLNMKTVKVKHLNNDTVQKKLEEIWFSEYEKVNKFSIDIDPVHLLKEHNGLFKYLTYHGAEKLGYDKIINQISDLKFNVKNPLSKKSKMKYTLNKLLNDVSDDALEENLMVELNDRIRFIKKFI